MRHFVRPMTRFLVPLVVIAFVLMVAGCSKEAADTLEFDGLIEEVSADGWLVTTADDVGFDKAWVSFDEGVAVPFEAQVGQKVRLTIKSQIKESYPVQVTATLVTLVDSPTSEAVASDAVFEKISAQEAKEMMASDSAYVLVDVRTQEEYDGGYIEGAMLLPLDDLESLAPQKIPALDTKILLYCRSGNRSGQAALLLQKLGYTQIYDFGGIIDWPYEIVKP